MAATRADLIARATEFTSTATATVNLALADASLSINTTNWGTKSNLGQIYLAAHYLKVWQLQSAAAAGPVNKRKDGDLEVGYAVATPAPELDDYSSTTWGRMYLSLRATIFSERAS